VRTTINTDLKSSADAILQRAISAQQRVPGVVAMVTDRNGSIYEAAAGQRVLG